MIRYEFSNTTTREEDIHPNSIFEKEKILAEGFIRSKHHETDGLDPCPISGIKRHEILFRKWGFDYALCQKTWTVALANKPVKEDLIEYFNNSQISTFRASEAYQRTVSETRGELWKGLIDWIEGRLFRYHRKDAYSILEIGTKNIGWIELLLKSSFVYHCSVEDPLPPVKDMPCESEVDLVTLLDVLQRHYDPLEPLKNAYEKLKPGGILMGTCRSGSGFDILTLRDASDSVFPFDHITLPSPMAMELLLQKAGYNVLEISTPGLFDAELVKKNKNDLPKDQYFQRYLSSNLDDTGMERLQLFLQANGLSSHLRFVAQKPKSQS
jgi:hypothetical protein